MVHRASSEPSTRPNKAGADSSATQLIATKGGMTTQIGHEDADSRRTKALHHAANLVCRRPRNSRQSSVVSRRLSGPPDQDPA
jgi:hypothetical protein